MAQLALAWSLANEFITAPIVGTTNLDSLKELIGMFIFHMFTDDSRYPYQVKCGGEEIYRRGI